MKTSVRSVLFVVTAVLTGAALGRTVTVPGDYDDIASALAAVDPASENPIDTISVAAGDYPVTAELVVDKPVKVVGAGRDKTFVWRSDKTANVARRVFSINNAAAVVSDVSITNGVASAESNNINLGGGGVLIGANGGTLANAIVEKCQLVRKTYGGGVAMVGAAGVVTNCIIRKNLMKDHQVKCAGLAMSAGLLVDSEVSENTMGGTNGEGLLGMGVYATGGTISGCTIKDNVSYNNDAPTPTFKGPGMYVAGAVTVTNTTISGNVGYDGFGGGIYHASGKLLVADSKIINNRCPSGAGIYSASGNDLTIERCVITNNIGWLDSGEKSPNVYYAANTTPTIVDSTIGRGGTAPVRTAKTYVVSAAAFPDHEPVYPYSSWATAATDIQAAVDATDDGGVCTVSNGTYTVYNSVVVDRALTLVSAEGNAVTTICGANDAAKALLPCAYRALLVNHAEAVVKGFTLTGGGRTEVWAGYVSSLYGTLLTVGGLGGLVTDCVF